MTRDSGFKRHIRTRAKRTGESYTTARAHLRRRSEAMDAELVSRIAAPLVARMRSEPNVVRTFTREQGSLAAFWILFVHQDDGLTGLVRAHPHRMLDPDFWTLLEIGLRDHDALLKILGKLRAELTTTSDVYALDPDVMRQLDAEFKAAIPGSLRRMANHLRAHTERHA